MITVYTKYTTAIPDMEYGVWLLAVADDPALNATSRELHNAQAAIVDAWNDKYAEGQPLDSSQFESVTAPADFVFPNE